MIISNTRVTSYNLCKRQHWYSYVRNLESRQPPLHIKRGYAGHSALEAYYREMQEGSSKELCKKALENSIIESIKKTQVNDNEQLSMLMELKVLLDWYTEYYDDKNKYKIHEVEAVFTTPISQDIRFGLVLDLLVEYISGTLRGDVVVIDHKFLLNFKSPEELHIDGQLPKYIKTVRSNGYFIGRAIFNQIRYRSLKNPKPEDVFRRTALTPTKLELNTVWEEQSEIVEEIVYNPAPPRRTLSPIVCKNCQFLQLCKAELRGEPTERMLEVNYKTRESPFKNE